MNTRTGAPAAVALAALMACVVLLPAAAQDSSVRVGGDFSYLDAKGLPPMSVPDGSRIYALQQIVDMDLSKEDLRAAILRLMDLRAAEAAYRMRVGTIEGSLVWSRPGYTPARMMYGGTDGSGTGAYATLAGDYRSRVNDIWRDLEADLDGDKASRLRRLITYEPTPQGTMTAFWDGIRRIDTILERWDAIASARAAGTEPPPFVETTTVITRAHINMPDPMWALPPTVTTDTLIDLLTWRLAVVSGLPKDFYLREPTREQIASPSFMYGHRARWRGWD